MVNHHQFWWRFFPKKELSQIYFSVALRSIAVSLIGIFIPLYLFQEKGLGLEKTLLFFVLYSVVFGITTPVAAKFSSRYGIRHSILLGIPFYLLFVALLYFLPNTVALMILASSLLGASQAFYWMGMHLAFHHASHPRHRGEEVGTRASVTVLSTMLGPFIGGALITWLGFAAVFMAAAVLLFMSGFLLLRSRENHVSYHFSLKSVFDTKNWKDSLFFVSRGTHIIADGVLWPLFIFFILGSYFSMGIVGSLMSLSGVLLLWGVGKYSDHADKRRIIRWTSVFDSLIWIAMAFINTALQLLGLTILASLVRAAHESPTGALEYDKAQGQVAAYFVNREIFICLGRILLLTVVIITNSITGGFIVQAAANFAAFLF